MQITKRYTLYFNQQSTNQPIIHDLIKKFNIETNILRAEIKSNAEGFTLLDMTAEEQELLAAYNYLKDKGVKIVPAKCQVELNKEKCVHCGACTGVCFAGALIITKPDWRLQFTPDKCIGCGLCFTACPLQALRYGVAEELQ